MKLFQSKEISNQTHTHNGGGRLKIKLYTHVHWTSQHTHRKKPYIENKDHADRVTFDW